MEKRKATSSFQRRRTLSFTAEENKRIANRDRRNLRFRMHAAAVLRRQAHHRRSERPEHAEIATTWGLRKHHFRVVKRTGHLAPLSEPTPGNPARHRSPERTTMIVKKLKRTSFKKSRSVMIGGLVDYILAGHDDRDKDKHTITEAQIF